MAFAERLEAMGRKKHDLEIAIDKMEKQPQPDEIALKRLKREKLALKDQIFALMDAHAESNDMLIQAAE
jgi:hypothetical protein